MNELQTVRQIADVTRDIRIKTGQFLMDAIDIGRLLYEAKSMVEPGKWSQYIAEELPFSHSWANNYMRLYKELGDSQISLFGDSQALGNLRPTQALELLALPAEERQEFMEEHDVEHMSTRELHQAIRERDEARQAKEEAEARAEEAAEKAQREIDRLKEELTDRTVENALKARVEAAESQQKSAEEKAIAAQKTADSLRKQLEAAKAETEKARAEIPAGAMEKLQKEAAEAAAKEAEKKLQKQLEAAETAASKAKAEKEEAEARAREAVEKLEAAQKAQKIADPDLTAVQLLGQQMMSTWNTMQGHRKKAVVKNPDNAAPLEAFLRQLIKTMEGSIDGTAG